MSNIVTGASLSFFNSSSNIASNTSSGPRNTPGGKQQPGEQIEVIHNSHGPASFSNGPGLYTPVPGVGGPQNLQLQTGGYQGYQPSSSPAYQFGPGPGPKPTGAPPSPPGYPGSDNPNANRNADSKAAFNPASIPTGAPISSFNAPNLNASIPSGARNINISTASGPPVRQGPEGERMYAPASFGNTPNVTAQMSTGARNQAAPPPSNSNFGNISASSIPTGAPISSFNAPNLGASMMNGPRNFGTGITGNANTGMGMGPVPAQVQAAGVDAPNDGANGDDSDQATSTSNSNVSSPTTPPSTTTTSPIGIGIDTSLLPQPYAKPSPALQFAELLANLSPELVAQLRPREGANGAGADVIVLVPRSVLESNQVPADLVAVPLNFRPSATQNQNQTHAQHESRLPGPPLPVMIPPQGTQPMKLPPTPSQAITVGWCPPSRPPGLLLPHHPPIVTPGSGSNGLPTGPRPPMPMVPACIANPLPHQHQHQEEQERNEKGKSKGFWKSVTCA